MTVAVYVSTFNFLEKEYLQDAVAEEVGFALVLYI
jgi:hypothetical protein